MSQHDLFRKRQRRFCLGISPFPVMLVIFALFVAYHNAPVDHAGWAAGVPGASDSDLVTASFSPCRRGKRINCVVDGDTFYVGGEKVRLFDINAPEVTAPQCPTEARLAAQATDRLRELLNDGPFTLVGGDRDRDRYGRKLRAVYRGGQSVGDVLVAEGLAHPWQGRRLNWCA